MDWYNNTVSGFLNESDDSIYSKLNKASENYAILRQQKDAWEEEIKLLKKVLLCVDGDSKIYFEYELPRIGRRVDVVVVAGGCVYCFEFKVQLSSDKWQSYLTAAKEQALTYAFDFSEFHSKSHKCPIVPILVATDAKAGGNKDLELLEGNVYKLICTNAKDLSATFECLYKSQKSGTLIESVADWENGVYEPTPTIVQAAERLFENHKVEDISRSGTDVTATIAEIEKIVDVARANSKKIVCFVTGEPGAGKTLVGLKLATGSTTNVQAGPSKIEQRVFLSGNLPLIQVLMGALTRDFYRQVTDYERYLNDYSDGKPAKKAAQEALLKYLGLEVKEGRQVPKALQSVYTANRCTLIWSKQHQRRVSESFVKRFFEAKIQLVSRFRKGFVGADSQAPTEHIVVFDEGQRAWDAKQIKKKDSETCVYQIAQGMSEPEALLRYLSLHKDWCVFVVLVGNGQDIHDGEAGIKQWYKTLAQANGGPIKDWQICYAPGGAIQSSDFAVFEAANKNRINQLQGIDFAKLHLKTSQREYRAPNFGAFIDGLIKGAVNQSVLAETKRLLGEIATKGETGGENFFIRVTHDLEMAKKWVAQHGHGTERRYGLLASSKAVRLRHFGIYTSGQYFDQVSWFLDGKESADSSYALEIAATEFEVQGLEMDYTIVGWDGDFFYDQNTKSFVCRKFSVKKNVWQEVADDTPDAISDDSENKTIVDREFESKDAKIQHLTNAYRVLLTRARQGMVIYIPAGDDEKTNPTSNVSDKNYAPTYKYLHDVIGIKELSATDFA